MHRSLSTGSLPMSRADRLAIALAQRLSPFVPDNLTIQAHSGTVEVYQGPNLVSGTSISALLDQGQDAHQEVTIAARATLANVQDAVVRVLRQKWPLPTRDEEIPLPGCKLIAGSLHLWYGNGENPSLALQPIPVGELS
jgi:hypothetical protein